MAQNTKAEPSAEAEKYISEEKGVSSADDAIAGACDIIAETVSDDADLRKRLRTLFNVRGSVSVSGSEQDSRSQSACH